MAAVLREQNGIPINSLRIAAVIDFLKAIQESQRLLKPLSIVFVLRRLYHHSLPRKPAHLQQQVQHSQNLPVTSS